MATKVRLGKLDVATEVVENFMFYLAPEEFEVIPVTVEHGIHAGLLPGLHKDPFDRMLIAQALAERVPLVSNDQALDGYGVKKLW
jgi:PIN domain nuclease of toxin-antitoxin system